MIIFPFRNKSFKVQVNYLGLELSPMLLYFIVWCLYSIVFTNNREHRYLMWYFLNFKVFLFLF